MAINTGRTPVKPSQVSVATSLSGSERLLATRVSGPTSPKTIAVTTSVLAGLVSVNLSAVASLVSVVIPNSGVSAGVYGTSTVIPQFTIGADGRVSLADRVTLPAFLTQETARNIWATFSASSGTVTADTSADTLHIYGGGAARTSITGDVLTVHVDQFTETARNMWSTVSASSGSATANVSADTLDVRGGGIARTSITGDVLTIHVDNPTFNETARNIWATVSASSGSTTADVSADNLAVRGGSGITTSITDDVLTIDERDSGVSAGTYGTSNGIPRITIDSKGRITSAAITTVIPFTVSTSGGKSLSISVALPVLNFRARDGISVDVSGGAVIPHLLSSGASAGTYGTSTVIPQITVDGLGRITLIERVTAPAAGGAQNLWATVSASSGSTTANSTTDTLDVRGGKGISTSITNDVLTIELVSAVSTAYILHAETSVVIGANTTVSGNNAIAIGQISQGIGDDSVLIGNNAACSGTGAVGIGVGVFAEKDYTVALGYFANASGESAIAVGNSSEADAAGAIAIGNAASIAGVGAIGIGSGTMAKKDGGVAIGDSAYVSATDSIAIGHTAQSYNDTAVVIGAFAGDLGTGTSGAVAIGYSANTNGNNNIAIGYVVHTTLSDAIGIGARVSVLSSGGIAIGTSARIPTSSDGAVAIGYNAVASASAAVAIGKGAATFSGQGTIALGTSAVAGGTGGLAIGFGASCVGVSAVAIGSHAGTGSGQGGVAIGPKSVITSGSGAVAIGKEARVEVSAGVAIGFQARTSTQNQIKLGRDNIDHVKSGGGIHFGTRSVSAGGTYNVTAGDGAIRINTTAVGGQTILNLPTPDNVLGQVLTIYYDTSAAGAALPVVHVSVTANERIITANGAIASLSFTEANQFLVLEAVASNRWALIGQGGPAVSPVVTDEFTLLYVASVSATTQIDILNIFSTKYQDYKLVLNNIAPTSVDNIRIRMALGNGTSVNTSCWAARHWRDTATGVSASAATSISIPLLGGLGVAVSSFGNGEWIICNPQKPDAIKTVYGDGITVSVTPGLPNGQRSYGICTQTAPTFDSLSLFFGSVDNFRTGSIKIYGRV
jgi:hypothetical protein